MAAGAEKALPLILAIHRQLHGGGRRLSVRPVEIITQGAAGSGPDVIARLVADKLSRLWQLPVTAEG